MRPAGGVETMSALVRGGAMTLGGSLLGRVAGVAQSIVIARGLDPHRLGVFAIVMVSLTLLFDQSLSAASRSSACAASSTR